MNYSCDGPLKHLEYMWEQFCGNQGEPYAHSLNDRTGWERWYGIAPFFTDEQLILLSASPESFSSFCERHIPSENFLRFALLSYSASKHVESSGSSLDVTLMIGPLPLSALPQKRFNGCSSMEDEAPFKPCWFNCCKGSVEWRSHCSDVAARNQTCQVIHVESQSWGNTTCTWSARKEGGGHFTTWSSISKEVLETTKDTWFPRSFYITIVIITDYVVVLLPSWVSWGLFCHWVIQFWFRAKCGLTAHGQVTMVSRRPASPWNHRRQHW